MPIEGSENRASSGEEEVDGGVNGPSFREFPGGLPVVVRGVPHTGLGVSTDAHRGLLLFQTAHEVHGERGRVEDLIEVVDLEAGRAEVEYEGIVQILSDHGPHLFPVRPDPVGHCVVSGAWLESTGASEQVTGQARVDGGQSAQRFPGRSLADGQVAVPESSPPSEAETLTVTPRRA